MPIADPYADDSAFDRADACDGNGVDDERSDQDNKVPVGSLRFLRSQMAMESDMNSRKVKAGREMTGDSGTLKEVRGILLPTPSFVVLICNIFKEYLSFVF